VSGPDDKSVSRRGLGTWRPTTPATVNGPWGANTARFGFLSAAAERFYVDYERIGRAVVGALRVEAVRNPYDRELSNLIGELSTRGDVFRVLWGTQDMHVFRDGKKRFRHPVVGALELDHETDGPAGRRRVAGGRLQRGRRHIVGGRIRRDRAMAIRSTAGPEAFLARSTGCQVSGSWTWRVKSRR
jgi:hypothetical protein